LQRELFLRAKWEGGLDRGKRGGGPDQNALNMVARGPAQKKSADAVRESNTRDHKKA